MNITKRKATYTSIIFGLVFFFLVIYLAIVGPNAYLDEKIHFLINVSVILVGFIIFLCLMLRTNKKGNIVDERDLLIQKKSYGISIIVTLLYVFSLSIILFIINRYNGTISVTWLWFIAYSTFAFSYFITSFIILLHYHKD